VLGGAAAFGTTGSLAKATDSVSKRPGPADRVFSFSTYARPVGMLFGNSGSTVLNLIILASAVVPLMIVGILCWIFWRAAHRKDDA
jgi:hypothetical protein